jgi:uncharacterized peroxidase-related enzyme
MARNRNVATTTDPVSCFPIPGLDEMPGDLRERMLAVQEKAGFIPNIFLLLARRPAEFRAFLAYHDALMDKREGLTAAEREMIVVAISSVNQCQYCVVAHGAILRIRAKDPTISELVGANWRKADNVSPKQKAMLAFALKVAEEAHLVSEADRQALRDAGFDEEEVWDIAAIAAFFSMSNRLANATELRPNREFHAMGRG